MLSVAARNRRMLVTAAVISLVVAGTFFGQDDHFPFGPHRILTISMIFLPHVVCLLAFLPLERLGRAPALSFRRASVAG